VSAVELAIRKVKSLSPKQAKELLVWLSVHQTSGDARFKPARRKPRRARSMRRVMAWYDSVRGTTVWEPPRMPDELVRRISL
jgi:hypothetical protein